MKRKKHQKLKKNAGKIAEKFMFISRSSKERKNLNKPMSAKHWCVLIPQQIDCRSPLGKHLSLSIKHKLTTL